MHCKLNEGKMNKETSRRETPPHFRTRSKIEREENLSGGSARLESFASSRFLSRCLTAGFQGGRYTCLILLKENNTNVWCTRREEWLILIVYIKGDTD